MKDMSLITVTASIKVVIGMLAVAGGRIFTHTIFNNNNYVCTYVRYPAMGKSVQCQRE